MDKATLLAQIHATHAAFAAAAARVDERAMAGPAPGAEGWTRKDVLVHVAWWSDHSARVIEALLAGREPYPRGASFDIDAHNADIAAAGRSRAVADVRRDEAEAFRRVVAAVEAATDADLFEAGRYEWLGGEALVATVASDTSEHYPEHQPQLGD